MSSRFPRRSSISLPVTTRNWRASPGVTETSPSPTRSRRRGRSIAKSANFERALREPVTRTPWTLDAYGPGPISYNAGMAGQSSFDVTSPVDFQEVDNALNQARKEVGQRYDFKGAKADIMLSATDKTLTLLADDEFKMNALWEIV